MSLLPASYEEIAKIATTEVLRDIPPFNVRDFVDRIINIDWEKLDNGLSNMNNSRFPTISQALSKFSSIPGIYKSK